MHGFLHSLLVILFTYVDVSEVPTAHASIGMFFGSAGKHLDFTARTVSTSASSSL
jgi:hypothetical protein